MRVRRSLLALGLVASSVAATGERLAVDAAVSPSEVVALVVEGVGFGHGRGMSQWGSYGRAVNGGQSWQQILDAYYGGTVLSTAPTSARVRVRLVGHDGASVVGVISTARRAVWAGVGYASLQARATPTPNRYDIYRPPRRSAPAPPPRVGRASLPTSLGRSRSQPASTS